MGKKGKKRQLNDNVVTDNGLIKKAKDDVSEALPKKKKLKINAENSCTVNNLDLEVANDVHNAADSESKKPKRNKKKKAEKKENAGKSTIEKSILLQNNVEKSKEATEDDKESQNINSIRKRKFKEKRKHSKEIRKELRKEEGNFSSFNKLTVEEMKIRIAEIQARETISKTAKRKLIKLKKKLSVEEGTIENTVTLKRKSDTMQDVSNKKHKKFKMEDTTKTEIIHQIETEKREASVNKNANKNSKKDKILENNKVNTPNKLKKEKLNLNQLSEQLLFVEDREKIKLQNSSKKKKQNSAEESEVNRVKRILEEVLNEKKQKGKKINVQNGVKDFANDDDDDDDDDGNDNSEGDKKNDTETLISRSKIAIKTNKHMKDDTSNDEENDKDENDDKDNDVEAEEEETSDSAEVDKTQTQQLSVKEIENKCITNDFNKKKLMHNNQNAGAGKKQRYVLFIGNLSYDATTVDIKKHFLTKVEKVKDVRIPSKPGTNTPRGFAYVELENSMDYEKGLSLHDTFINGRKINVQYTSSGSKHVWNKQEIVHKNKKLHAMRKAGMLAGSKKTFQKRSFRRKPDKKLKTES